MDELSNQELFSAILSSNILLPYLDHDPELAMLLETPNHCNIHYSKNYASASQMIPVLKGMLEYMNAKMIYLNRDATRRLVNFGEAYPDSQIYDVTFNCERQSYGVCCGQTEESLRVICVLTGGHIPDELFEGSLE